MTAPDFRALCAELADDLEPWITYGEIEAIERSHDLIDRARALLAQLEGEGPTTAELMSLSAVCNSPSVFARAVLDRWGLPAPQPPVDGEVAELVEWLGREAVDFESIGEGAEPLAHRYRRTAELLQRFASPRPIPVTPTDRERYAADLRATVEAWRQREAGIFAATYQHANAGSPAQ